MKQLIDYIPLIAFLIVYKLDERLINIGSFEYTLGGIFSATEVLVASSILVYGSIFLVNGKLSRSHLFLLSAVVIFCSFTLIFREEAILKWKAPVVNWIFACVFIGSQYFNKQNMAQIMLGHIVELPAEKWKTLNFAWAGVFLCWAVRTFLSLLPFMNTGWTSRYLGAWQFSCCSQFYKWFISGLTLRNRKRKHRSRKARISHKN